jgi:triacylglycerol lipase
MIHSNGFVCAISIASALTACVSSSEPGTGSVNTGDGTGRGSANTAPITGSGAPYPIVLLHGMAGFDKLKGLNIEYFNGVVEDLASIGETDVFVTVAPPFDTSEDRAAGIAPQIQAILAKTGKAKVNIIAHSQGGIDARVLASPAGLNMGDVIASVTTIATPHQGSLVADLLVKVMNALPTTVVDSVTSAALDLFEATLYDVQSDPHLRAQVTELSHAYMTSTFNPQYVDDSGVTYSSYGGRTNLETGVADCAPAVYPNDPNKVDIPQPYLLPTATYLQGTTDVSNDGLVSVQSAHWGTFLQCVPADHLKEVGQLLQSGTNIVSGFDHLQFFRDVVARVRAAGF